MSRNDFIDNIPNCISGDMEKITALFMLADTVAANCSATNGQIVDAMSVLLGAFVKEGTKNEAIMPKVADRIAQIK